MPSSDKKKKPSSRPRGRSTDPLLVEVAWEVVNQVGGIYTVVRSKLAAMTRKWGAHYCLLGPYVRETASVEFEPARLSGPFGSAAKALRDEGIDAHFGRWLVVGRPRVVLLGRESGYQHLGEMRHELATHHHLPLPDDQPMLNDVLAFGWLVDRYLAALAEQQSKRRPIIAHLHEWQGSAAIPILRQKNRPVSIVFTTHATMLGRYLAASDPWYYDHVPFVDWAADAKRLNIEAQVHLERAAAHGAHVLTTVSNITAYECEHLLGRKVDVVTPNGLNIERFTAFHEFQNLHRRYKERIHEFVMGHFFPSYGFDLDKTLYFFTSGRYEYGNKGFDLTVEALARLNARLKRESADRTVVFFMITRRPVRGINAEALSSRAIMDELRRTCDAIKEQVGERLFYASAVDQKVDMNELVDEYWRLRLRRTIQAWKTGRWPILVTHDLVDDSGDELLNKVRQCHLLNHEDDRVKIVYHPDFITASNPLWGMDYDEFVRGCHLGVFPSFYEPWGYTPLECVARGIPAVSSDVSGFGSYVTKNWPDHEDAGVYVLKRRDCGFDEAANRLAERMFRLVMLDRRDRIALRNKVDQASAQFDWENLSRWYDEAHELVLQRSGPAGSTS
ncbi:MAG: glycosyltransferase [Phycisphaerae bacterium]|nr:glycosyltransferase [Phycisphaerae bacterium]